MYYRRKWLSVLVAFVGLIRAAFGMSWPRTLQGAWYVLRANQKWAPFPDNDPDAARAPMARFYRMPDVPDTRRAAELAAEWWRVHRGHQHGGAERAQLDDALADLYAYSYGVERESVRTAAALRAEAMDVSDEWVAAGCDPED